ncbi:MAG: FlgT C-terminal domain-containing protein [bacterium]
MDDKTKLIIIISLAAVLLISLVVNLQIYGAKKTVEQELGYAKSENELLTKKFQESHKENKELQGKLDTLTSELNKISQDKEELQRQHEEMTKKYDTLLVEKEKLDEKLKGQTSLLPAAPSKEENTYWAELVKEKTNLELQLKTLKASNEQLKSEKGALEVNLSNLMREKQDLQEQFQYHQKMLDNMASEFIWEKNARFQMQDKLAPIKNENAFLRRQLSIASNNKAKLQKKLEQLITEKNILERRITEIEIFLKDRLSGMGDVRQQAEELLIQPSREAGAQYKKESVELPQIVVRPQSETSSYGDSQDAFFFGNILSVNENNNFVVIDLGEDAGVRPGQKFQVYRGNEVIANIEAMQVRKNISACDIKKQSISIHAGDKVK